MIGNESVGIDVLAARDNCIIGRLGPVPPAPGPGQIMVARGVGSRGFFDPAFPDIEQDERTWVWDFRGGETQVGFPFTPFHLPPGPGDRWFFSGPPVAGQMCLTIPRFNWDPNCKIYISARMRDHPSNLGHDHLSACIRFPAGRDVRRLRRAHLRHDPLFVDAAGRRASRLHHLVHRD